MIIGFEHEMCVSGTFCQKANYKVENIPNLAVTWNILDRIINCSKQKKQFKNETKETKKNSLVKSWNCV